MRRWLIRGWWILTGVMMLMLIPGVALADNCSAGNMRDCANSAAAAAAIAAAAGAIAAGGFFSGSGNSTQQGPNDPKGGVSDPLQDLMKDVFDAANPPEPGVFDEIWDEIQDFVRAQVEGFQDFVDEVEDVGEDIRHDIDRWIDDALAARVPHSEPIR